MTRLKIHNMAEGGTPQRDIANLCGVGLRSVVPVLAESVPTRDEVVADERAGASRRGRPSKADDAMIARIRLLLEDPSNGRITAIEVLRRATEWGYTGGRNQLTELVKKLRPAPPKEPIVKPVKVKVDRARPSWAEILWRVFEVDGWRCARCGCRMTLRTVFEGGPTTSAVLASLRRSAYAPRGPPGEAR